MVNYFENKVYDLNDNNLIINFCKQFEEVFKITMPELLRQ
jgi:hypothetical protein